MGDRDARSMFKRQILIDSIRLLYFLLTDGVGDFSNLAALSEDIGVSARSETDFRWVWTRMATT